MEFVELKRKWNLANSTTINWTDSKVISKLTVNDFMNITELFFSLFQIQVKIFAMVYPLHMICLFGRILLEKVRKANK